MYGMRGELNACTNSDSIFMKDSFIKNSLHVPPLPVYAPLVDVYSTYPKFTSSLDPNIYYLDTLYFCQALLLDL